MPGKNQTLTLEAMHSQLDTQFHPGDQANKHSVGLELEIWPFRETAEHGAQLVRFHNEQGTGLIDCLRKMEANIDSLRWAPKQGLARFEISDGGQLTFEPGGQLEYSGPPKETLGEAISDITQVIESLRCNLKAYGIWLFHSGLNPWYRVDEIGLLLDAPRYTNMNNFFQAVGPYGQRMMRQSTSLQVNLDIGPSEIAIRRWLAANLLAPIFTALFGNSPFVDGKATGAYSFRSLIWQHLDPSRTGFPPGMLAEEYKPCPVEQYMGFGLNAKVMRLPNAAGDMSFGGEFKSFREWMKQGHNGWFPDIEDWKTHLSTLFPEVRVRGFMETRFLDAQSKVWCSVPGILLTHLIYNREAMEKVISWLMPYRTTLPGMLEVAAKKGMDEDEIASLAQKIYRLALDLAMAGEQPRVAKLCERFYSHYTHRNCNPAAELVRLNDGKVFSPQQYRDFEKAQVDNAGDILSMICDYY